ncbi:MAG TPA: 2OG-Fe(II) oxygenase [Vicinamibacterales bacterium]|nr:2OG-Fe(II) oxygenase [Vicinamibacterales bacterium]
MSAASPSESPAIESRIARYDWTAVADHLDAYGWTTLPALLTAAETTELGGLYDHDELFRSHVVMARHGFGRGEYKYFEYPLPKIIDELRTSVYQRLVPTANRWNDAMGFDVRYPAAHSEYLARCHAAGQTRPTPLLLRYTDGDFNALHQDVYGAHLFPLQAMVLLSEPGRDFSGGEFVLTEQRPRMQSRVEVVPLARGDAAVWAVRHRPVRGARGNYRVTMRHGVSRIRSGHRQTAGIIFHDAK